MARDYKQRPKTRRPAPRRKTPRRISSGTSFGIGLCVGAVVTALIFVNGSKLNPGELASKLVGGDDAGVEETSFEFYTLLPGKEIVVPDREPPPAPVTPAVTPKSEPDTRRFMLQAASFRNAMDADGLKARLALLGLEATVQQVKIKDSGTWFRVRLGPYTGQQATDEVKARLKGQKIQVLTTRLR